MMRFSLLLVFLGMGLLSCQHSAKGIAHQGGGGVSFPLPEIPSLINSPAGRDAYLAAHYWDRVDISDKCLLSDREVFDKAFVRFTYLLGAMKKSSADEAIRKMMQRFKDDKEWTSKLIETADFYLFDIESPIVNEPMYQTFVAAALESPTLDEMQRIKYQDQWEVSSKNNPGHLASDFAFVTRDGKRGSLRQFVKKSTILYFTDPECDNCMAATQALVGSKVLQDLYYNGQLDILAIYTEGNKEVWQQMTQVYPKAWTLGFDAHEAIRLKRIYELRAMPSLYLLDANGRVILKDKPVDTIIEFLIEQLGPRRF